MLPGTEPFPLSEASSSSADELLEAYRTGRISPVEVIDATAERIERLNPVVHAFTTLCLDRARVEARAAEATYRRDGRGGALLGVPFAAKDIFDSAGVRTTYGSAMFTANIPSVDAEAVRRARAAGAILVGKTATHEFAWGITSVNPAMGTPVNPWAPERVPGGSSGGSAVALATQLVPVALGTDTGGSIRIPSCFCGTCGLKPTFGRVSVAGAWPLAPTLDHAGPMARTPQDLGIVLSAIAGMDPADSATLAAPTPTPTPTPAPAPAPSDRAPDAGGMSVGICPALHPVPLSDAIQAVFEAAIKTLESLGVRVVKLDLPGVEHIYEAFAVIQRGEALQVHRSAGLFPSREDEYGDDVRERLRAATTVTLADYLSAAEERQAVKTRFAALFADVDVLMTPVSAGPPVRIGERSVTRGGREMTFRELVMPYTVPQDVAGLPSCAVRAGFDELGIPTAVQFTAPWWHEAQALAAAAAFFDATAEIQQRWPTPQAPTRDQNLSGGAIR